MFSEDVRWANSIYNPKNKGRCLIGKLLTTDELVCVHRIILTTRYMLCFGIIHYLKVVGLGSTLSHLMKRPIS